MVDGDGRRDGQPKALIMTDSDGSRFDPSLSCPTSPLSELGFWLSKPGIILLAGNFRSHSHIRRLPRIAHAHCTIPSRCFDFDASGGPVLSTTTDLPELELRRECGGREVTLSKTPG